MIGWVMNYCCFDATYNFFSNLRTTSFRKKNVRSIFTEHIKINLIKGSVTKSHSIRSKTFRKLVC